MNDKRPYVTSEMDSKLGPLPQRYLKWVRNLVIWSVIGGSCIYLSMLGIKPAWTQMTTDFPNYYVASLVIVAGEDPTQLYDDKRFNEILAEKGVTVPGRFSTFPPATAFVMMPLAMFSPMDARRVWTLINILALFLMVVCLQRLIDCTRSEAAFLVLLNGGALVSNIRLGQVYLVIVALCCLALVLEKQGRHILAGMLVAIGISTKYFPVVFLAYWFFTKRKQACIATVVACMAVTLSEWLVFGFDTWAVFVTETFFPHLGGQIEGQGEGHHLAYQSFNSFYRNLFVGHSIDNPNPLIHAPWLYGIFQYGTVFVILAQTCRRWVQVKSADGDHYRLMVMGFAVMVLLPITASYHLVLLVPFMALAVPYYLRQKQYVIAIFLLGFYGALGFAPFWRLSSLPSEDLYLLAHYHRLWILLAIWSLVALERKSTRS